jgi:dGTPase
MVKDLINNTIKNIKYYKIKKLIDVYNNSYKIVSFSNEFEKVDKEIRFFLRSKMYNNKKVLAKNNKGKKIIKTLFKLISNNPNKFLRNYKFKKIEKFRAVADFISGMTDRYAINLYNKHK